MSLTPFLPVYIRLAPMSLSKALDILSTAVYYRSFTMNEDFHLALKFAYECLLVLNSFTPKEKSEDLTTTTKGGRTQ